MRAKYLNKTIIVSFIILVIIMLFNSTLVTKNVISAFNMWKTKVFPSLFPFFVISDILIGYNLVYYLSKLFNKPLTKLFRTSSNVAFVFIMSILSGFPSSAKYTKELFLEGYISENDAKKALTFTHFSNPLFIIAFSKSIFNNSKITIIILLSHYLSNIIIGLIFKNKYLTKEKTIPIKKRNNQSFGLIFTNAILKSINIMFLILGIIISFVILNSLLSEIFNFNVIINTIIGGFLEITQGLNLLATINLSTNLKIILFTSFISFGGLSVHMQIKSILSDTSISFRPFFKARILHTIISVLFIILMAGFL